MVKETREVRVVKKKSRGESGSWNQYFRECFVCDLSWENYCEVQVIAVFPCYRVWLDASFAFSFFQPMEPHDSGHLNLQHRFIDQKAQLFCSWVLTPPLAFSTPLLWYTA